MCVHGLNVGVIARGTVGGREPVVLFFAIDTAAGTVAAGQQRLRAPTTPAGAAPSR